MKSLLLLSAVAFAMPEAPGNSSESCEQAAFLQRASKLSDLAPCKEEDAVYELFGSQGLLIAKMATSEVQDVLTNGILGLRDMTDCGTPGRKTCSAWTFLRSDLPPMVFGTGSEFISILTDPGKVWDLVSTMSVPDANSDSRRACSTAYPFQPSVGGTNAFGPGKASLPQAGEAWHCMTGSAAAAGVDPGDIVYQPSGDIGQVSLPASCPVDDHRCRFLNSGGCLSRAAWGNATACTDPNDPLFPKFQSCYTFSEVSANESEVTSENFTGKYFEVRFNKDCSPCNIPNKCVTKNTQSPEQPGWFPFYNQSADEFQMLVGQDGSQWPERMYGSDTLRYGIRTQWYSGDFQCIWNKSDWDSWSMALRTNYETLLQSAEDGPPDGGNTWLFAYPDDGVWGFYNEVDFYVDNDTDSTQFLSQNEIFLNSIVGISVDQESCRSSHSFLNGQCSRKGPNDPVCCDADCRCPWENATQFEINLQEANEDAIALAAMLGDQLQKRVPVLKMYPAAANAPNRQVFEQFSSSDGFPGRELFKPFGQGQR